MPIVRRTSNTFRALVHLRTAAAELQSAAYAPDIGPTRARVIRRLGHTVQRDLPALARAGLPPQYLWAVADAARGSATLGTYRSRFSAYGSDPFRMARWAADLSAASDQLSAIATLRRR